MNQKAKVRLSGAAFALFLLLLLLVKTLDVAVIGPNDTRIGLSHLNQAFHELTGVKLFWYDLTQGFGILALIVAGLFGVLGLWQLVGRKKLLAVDHQILALGVLFVIVIGLYVFFEIVVVNYRPIVMPGDTAPEASFPSSHTMLVCAVLGGGMLTARYYIKNPRLLLAVQVLGAVIIVLTVIGRLICGVHWFTDILGGLLLSVALLAAFWAVLDKLQRARLSKKCRMYPD